MSHQFYFMTAMGTLHRTHYESTTVMCSMKASINQIFQGSGFIQAASITDYRVSVGNASCEVISLTDNLLRCLPPPEPPSGTGVQSSCEKDTFEVQVIVSTYTIHAYCLKYKIDCKAFGLSVAVGVLAVAIVSLVVAIVVITKRKTKEVEQRRKELTVDENIKVEAETKIDDPDYQSVIEGASTFGVEETADSNYNSLHRQPISEEAQATSTYDLLFQYEPNDRILA